MTAHSSRVRKAALGSVLIVALSGMLSACAVEEEAPSGDGAGGAPITIGLITSTTGNLAEAGESFINGFEAGLDYLTDGTNVVDGHEIKLDIRNDNGDAATGIAAATELLGNGVKIITGPGSSAVAVPVADLTVQNGATFVAGPAGTTALLGNNKSIFTSGPGGWMANQGLVTALGDDVKRILFLGQDYAFGIDSADTIEAAAAERGITTDRMLLPSDTTDFTGAVAQIKQDDPDVLIVSWPGTGEAQLFGALADQDVYSQMQVSTGLTYRNAIASFLELAGDNRTDVGIVSTYYEGFGGGNELETAMIEYANETDSMVDFVHPQGFTAAQMIVHAIEESPELDPADVTEALSGWEFDTPVGKVQIREQDHLVTTPAWVSKAVDVDGKWGLEPVTELSGADLAAGIDSTGRVKAFSQ